MRKTILCTVLPILIFAASSFAQPTAGTQLQRAITQQFLANYADKLEARLKNRSVGYSFTIAGGRGNLMVSRAGGDARRAPDANARKMSADDKFNIASVSKTVTAGR